MVRKMIFVAKVTCSLVETYIHIRLKNSDVKILFIYLVMLIFTSMIFSYQYICKYQECALFLSYIFAMFMFWATTRRKMMNILGASENMKLIFTLDVKTVCCKWNIFEFIDAPTLVQKDFEDSLSYGITITRRDLQ